MSQTTNAAKNPMPMGSMSAPADAADCRLFADDGPQRAGAGPDVVRGDTVPGRRRIGSEGVMGHRSCRSYGPTASCGVGLMHRGVGGGRTALARITAVDLFY
jgi:hypothetical protein